MQHQYIFSEDFPQTFDEHNSHILQYQHNSFLKLNTQYDTAEKQGRRWNINDAKKRCENDDSKMSQRFEIKITRVWNKQRVSN